MNDKATLEAFESYLKWTGLDLNQKERNLALRFFRMGITLGKVM